MGLFNRYCLHMFINPDCYSLEGNGMTTTHDIATLLPPQVELVRISGMRVTLRMKADMATPERGAMLLNFEKFLREATTEPYEIFLEPRGDMNKLRIKLRGVEL